ncbi:DUF1559 domain-containing protein [Aeoliella sp.]|uniref:DUF1559 family PulG-like putative transporter n=1 Tax=Aeoliella sp. TaxID=2795800 RepID=UPI003CCC4040
MPDNPYESTELPHGKKRPKSAISVLVALLAVAVVLLLLVALLIPAQRGVPAAARRVACTNNMKQILLALHNYHDANGELPPAYTVDDDGNRLHSWRALILPYMEGNNVAEFIDYSKPWDDPANAEARDCVVETYLCPSAAFDDEHLTTYVAVVGPEFLFSGPEPRKFSDVSDGNANTIAVLEIGYEHAVHWMSPEDVDEEFVINNVEALDTGHPGIFIAGYLDGSVHNFEQDIDRQKLRALLTIAGREPIDEDE